MSNTLVQSLRASKHLYTIMLFSIIVIGVGLRMVNISAEPLWYDEIFGVSLATNSTSISEILEYSKETYYSPFYYIVLRVWFQFFQSNELYSRLLSLLFSVGSISLLYYFGKKLFGSRPALIAALLMAIAPLQVEFGQEARPYSIFAFLALLSMYYFWKFLENPRNNKNLLIILCVNVLGIYMHYDYFILIFSQIGIVFLVSTLPYYSVDGRLLFKKAFMWWLAQGVLFLPWFLYALLPSFFGVQYALSLGVPNILDTFIEGDLWFNVQGAQERFQALLALAGQVAVVFALGLGLHKFYFKIKKKREFDNETLAVFFLCMWYLLSLSFYFISPLSAQYTPNWQRHIIIFSPPLFLLIGYGLSKISSKFVKNSILGCIVLSALLPLIMVIGNDADWSENHDVAPLRYIEQHEQDRDYILIPGTPWEAFHLYHFKGRSDIGGFLPMHNFNSIDARDYYKLPSIEEFIYAYTDVPSESNVGVAEMERILEPYNRVWLLFGTEVNPIFNWFIMNWELVDCPEDFCPNVHLFERPNEKLNAH